MGAEILPERIIFSYGEGLRIEDYDVGELGSNDVLVRIRFGGLCASDIHYMNGDFRYGLDPIVPGHEGSGVVEAVGEDVDTFSRGDQVIIDYVSGCGSCLECRLGRENWCESSEYYGFERNGTFQEYMVVTPSNLVRAPRNLSLKESCIVGCAVVTPYHAIRGIGGVWDRVVLVVGLGGVGLHALLLSRLLGARIVIGVDIDGRKEDLAYRFGADYFIDASKIDPVEEVYKLSDGFGVDVSFEYVGSIDAIYTAIESLGNGGVAVLGGLFNKPVPINFTSLISDEKRIFGFEDHNHNDLVSLVSLIEDRNINLSSSISHVYRYSEVYDAIDMFRSRDDLVSRIVIDFG